MKQPIYESYVGALDDILFPPAGTPRGFVMADLYTFALSTGEMLRYTTADVDIGYLGNTWSSKTVRVDTSASKAVGHWKTGLDVDTWQVVMFPRPVDPLTGALYPDKIGNQPWIAAVRAGALDGAVVDIDRAYRKTWPQLPTPGSPGGIVTPAAVLPIQGGRIAEVDGFDSGAVVNINSHMELLNAQMPRNLYQQGCIHTLFGPGCNVSGSLPQSSFAASGTVLAGSTRLVINSALGNPAGSGTYALGQIVFTSGQNAGYSMMIVAWMAGQMTLRSGMPFDVAPGDTFTAYPGCDKSQATCTKFGNQLNFGGVPYTPIPETAV